MVKAKNLAHDKKIFVLDTNVLLHDPTAMFAFGGAQVGIPSVVLEEIDKFKKEGTDRGRNSRETIRLLDSLRSQGSLREGVALDNGGILKVIFLEHDLPELPFKLNINDNEILLTACVLKNSGYTVKFISKDLNARVKADALGIETEDYLKEYVTEDDFYQGWITVPVPAIQLKKEFPSVLQEVITDADLAVNQFVLVESQHNPHNYKIFRYLGGTRFLPVQEPTFKWPFQAHNPQQLMALNLLLDDSIQFLTLMGPAGTGKTFLALLTGLHKVLVEEQYEKMLISRPVIPLGRDVGFLPGELKEKLHNWMLPIYDNMEFITHSTFKAKHDQEQQQGEPEAHPHKYKGKGKHKKHHNKEHKAGGLVALDELIHRGKVSLEAITYMRGRSIPYQFILIDEAQNLTPHEVKALVTRVGAGSKIILTGDPYQIDSPYLDFSSNGLITTSERFKGQQIFGSVFLSISERSELSKIAGELL